MMNFTVAEQLRTQPHPKYVYIIKNITPFKKNTKTLRPEQRSVVGLVAMLTKIVYNSIQ